MCNIYKDLFCVFAPRIVLIKVIFANFGLLTFFWNSFFSHFRAFLLDYFDNYRTVNSSSQYWGEVKKKDEDLLILPDFQNKTLG